MNQENIPPQSVDIERAVLGAMFFEQESVDITLEKLNDEDFYKPQHMIIFNTIKTLKNNNIPIDFLTVTEELKKTEHIDEVGGEAYIASLCGEINSSANISYHCDILKNKSVLRKLIALTTSIKNSCYQNNADPNIIAAELYSQSVAVVENREIRPYRSVSEIVFEAYDWIIKKSEQNGTMGVSTGLSILDKYTDGWNDGDLIIIKGETGQGKSALAINSFALKAAQKDVPTAIFSLEMNDIQIVTRMFSKEARTDLSEIQYKKPDNDTWKRLSDAQGRIGKLPIYIDETTGLDITKIGVKLRRLQKDKGIKLAIVDYLQLIEGDDAQNREREVASISRGLKLLSKSLRIPIIALSQVNEIGKARESRAIEQDADKVIFIDFLTEDEKRANNFQDCHNIRKLCIQKNRGGKTGQVFVKWVPEHVDFKDVEY